MTHSDLTSLDNNQFPLLIKAIVELHLGVRLSLGKSQNHFDFISENWPDGEKVVVEVKRPVRFNPELARIINQAITHLQLHTPDIYIIAVDIEISIDEKRRIEERLQPYVKNKVVIYSIREILYWTDYYLLRLRVEFPQLPRFTEETLTNITVSLKKDEAQQYILDTLTSYYNIILANGLNYAIRHFDPDFENKSIALLTASNRVAVLSDDKPLEWFYEPGNIGHFSIVGHLENLRKKKFPDWTAAGFFNMLLKQVELFQGFAGYPSEHLNHLKYLRLPEDELHFLIPEILIWHNDNVYSPSSEGMSDLLKTLEDFFKGMYKGATTEEKKVYNDALYGTETPNISEKVDEKSPNYFEVSEDIIGQHIQLNIPHIDLDSAQRTWIYSIYDKFEKNEEVEIRSLLASLWKSVPADFDAYKIPGYLLHSGKLITLPGVAFVHPDAQVINDFDEVLRAIQDFIKENNSVEKVFSEQIQQKHPHLTPARINKVFKLLSIIPGMQMGSSSNDGFITSITIDNDAVYRKYLGYKNLQSFIDEVYSFKRTAGAGINKPPGLTVSLNKTPLRIRAAKDFDAVMGIQGLAGDLAEIIHHLPAEKGQMIGIFGKWGRGKTMFLSELWKNLEKKTDTAYTQVTYHAWKYQETPASWAYLYELFSTKYLGEFKKGNKLSYLKKLWKLNMTRLTFLQRIYFVSIFLVIIASLAALAAAFLVPWYWTILILTLVPAADITLLKSLHKSLAPSARDLIKKFGTRQSFKQEMGLQAEIEKEIITLLKVWIKDEPKEEITKKAKSNTKKKSEKEPEIKKRKIVLFVEDVDRCTEERIIQNIDALRIMLEDDEVCKRLIIITAIDESILKKAVEHKYKALYSEQKESLPKLTGEYLDKLFILAIKLGNLTTVQRNEFVTELLKNEVDGVIEAAKITETEYINVKVPATPGVAIDHIIPNKVGETAKTENLIQLTSAENARSEEPKIEKLTTGEIAAFRNQVQEWREPTPRQIKIFYYRYLLLKNLLINFYDQRSELNPWEDQANLELILGLLARYSSGHNLKLMNDEKENIYQNLDLNENASNDFFGLKYNRSMSEWRLLFEMLELVISY